MKKGGREEAQRLRDVSKTAKWLSQGKHQVTKPSWPSLHWSLHLSATPHESLNSTQPKRSYLNSVLSSPGHGETRVLLRRSFLFLQIRYHIQRLQLLRRAISVAAQSWLGAAGSWVLLLGGDLSLHRPSLRHNLEGPLIPSSFAFCLHQAPFHGRLVDSACDLSLQITQRTQGMKQIRPFPLSCKGCPPPRLNSWS